MPIRSIVFLILLALPVLSAPNQKKAFKELAKNSTYQEGAKAMDGQLPDIAVDRFRSVLEDNKLSSDAQAYTCLLYTSPSPRDS